MLHIHQQDTKVLLSDITDSQGIERGLYVKSNIPLELVSTFEQVKNRGYFPIGIVVDDSNKMEILFKRHPKQTDEMKMKEVKVENPNVL